MSIGLKAAMRCTLPTIIPPARVGDTITLTVKIENLL